jgi:hypothetical protein
MSPHSSGLITGSNVLRMVKRTAEDDAIKVGTNQLIDDKIIFTLPRNF